MILCVRRVACTLSPQEQENKKQMESTATPVNVFFTFHHQENVQSFSVHPFAVLIKQKTQSHEGLQFHHVVREGDQFVLGRAGWEIAFSSVLFFRGQNSDFGFLCLVALLACLGFSCSGIGCRNGTRGLHSVLGPVTRFSLFFQTRYTTEPRYFAIIVIFVSLRASCLRTKCGRSVESLVFSLSP